MEHKHLITFSAALIVALALGTFLFLYFYPHLMYDAYEKGIIGKGLGNGPIPVNTLYAVPTLASASTTGSKLLTTGANNDTLYIAGWLDLSKGPQVLNVPAMGDRYYSVQLTDPQTGTDFAYVGTRATGAALGDYLITGPDWKGIVPDGMTQIASPDNSVLVLGRILVYGDSDTSTAYNLAKQIELTPLGQWLVSGSQGIPAK